MGGIKVGGPSVPVPPSGDEVDAGPKPAASTDAPQISDRFEKVSANNLFGSPMSPLGGALAGALGDLLGVENNENFQKLSDPAKQMYLDLHAKYEKAGDKEKLAALDALVTSKGLNQIPSHESQLQIMRTFDKHVDKGHAHSSQRFSEQLQALAGDKTFQKLDPQTQQLVLTSSRIDPKKGMEGPVQVAELFELAKAPGLEKLTPEAQRAVISLFMGAPKESSSEALSKVVKSLSGALSKVVASEGFHKLDNTQQRKAVLDTVYAALFDKGFSQRTTAIVKLLDSPAFGKLSPEDKTIVLNGLEKTNGDPAYVEGISGFIPSLNAMPLIGSEQKHRLLGEEVSKLTAGS